MIKKNHILIIDDDPTFRILVRRMLESSGLQATEAQDLHTAFKQIEKAIPDLILLDLNLSNETGNDFLQLRLKNPRIGKIPVIICSAENRNNMIKKNIGLKVDDYILKPIQRNALIKKVKIALENKAFLEYQFTPEEASIELNVHLWSEVISIGEAYCKIRAPFAIAKNGIFQLDLKGLKEFLPKPQICRANEESKYVNSGIYDTFCTLVGVSEADSFVIRKLKMGWRQIKDAKI